MEKRSATVMKSGITILLMYFILLSNMAIEISISPDIIRSMLSSHAHFAHSNPFTLCLIYLFICGASKLRIIQISKGITLITEFLAKKHLIQCLNILVILFRQVNHPLCIKQKHAVKRDVSLF